MLFFENIPRSYHYTGTSHWRKNIVAVITQDSLIDDNWAIPEKHLTGRVEDIYFTLENSRQNKASLLWCSFSIKLSCLPGRSNKINTILYDRYCLQNCKAITFAKIADHTKYKKPNVLSHHHIFWMNSDKADNSFLYPFLLLGKQIFEICLGRDNKYLGVSFKWGGAWVKMPWINTFSRNVNSINLKIFPTWWNIKVWEKIQQEFRRERKSPREFIEIWRDVSLRLILKDKGGNQYCLSFCWF